MLDYYALQALATVARERSFSKASKALFITQSAISQRIMLLENKIGQPLLIRSPSIKPTAVGNQLLAHFKQINLLEESLRKKLSPNKLSSPIPIPIAVNTESLSTWFVDAVKPVLKKGHLVLELFIEDQERTINFLSTGKVWGCVTSISDTPFGCASTFLGHMIYRLVATPSFKKKYFKKRISGKELLQTPAAIYGERDYMHENYLRQHFRTYKKGQPTHHYVPSPLGLVQFAVDGLAYALLPEPSIKAYLKKGQLIDLLPSKPFKLSLYWQTQELQTEITKKLSQCIVSNARSILQ